jgi:tripartite-type tricarboxylate transporter receptor subunit TctC
MKTAAIVAAATLAGASQAAYPDKPVHVVVGFSAGGPTDVVARAFAAYAGQALGQTFIVENRPGANTILAAEYVAKAPADGYTLLFGATNHTMIPALYRDRVKFDALRSYTPICTLAVSPTVLVVGPSMPVKTLDGFFDAIKAQPGRRTFATPGTGSSGHLATEQLLKQTGTSMNHIPYKGAAQAISDLMGGQVDSSLATLGSVLPQIQSGKLTALAVSSPQRLPQLPGVPTFEQAGVKHFSAEAWYGVLGPAGLPPDVENKLEKAAREYDAAPQTAKSLEALGMQPRATCGRAFTDQMAREITEYTALARDLNLKAE